MATGVGGCSAILCQSPYRLVIREIERRVCVENHNVHQGRVFTWRCFVGGKEKHAVRGDDSLGAPSVIQVP